MQEPPPLGHLRFDGGSRIGIGVTLGRQFLGFDRLNDSHNFDHGLKISPATASVRHPRPCFRSRPPHTLLPHPTAAPPAAHHHHCADHHHRAQPQPPTAVGRPRRKSAHQLPPQREKRQIHHAGLVVAEFDAHDVPDAQMHREGADRKDLAKPPVQQCHRCSDSDDQRPCGQQREQPFAGIQFQPQRRRLRTEQFLAQSVGCDLASQSFTAGPFPAHRPRYFGHPGHQISGRRLH